MARTHVTVELTQNLVDMKKKGTIIILCVHTFCHAPLTIIILRAKQLTSTGTANIKT